MVTAPRFTIGTEFIRRITPKLKRTERIVDIYRTYNDAGELVKLRYVTAHDFLGQTVLDYDVNDTTIARCLHENGAPVPV